MLMLNAVGLRFTAVLKFQVVELDNKPSFAYRYYKFRNKIAELRL